MAKGSGGGGRSSRGSRGREQGYTSKPARYARNSTAVDAPSSGGSLASRAAMLAQAVGGKYRSRESAIVMSNSAFRRFERLYKEGYSGSVTGGLITPSGEFLDRGVRR